ncbi:GDYXXLXY domain-containing protein [Halobacillus mangrovi]|uniref:GDYXXLXY domain-containing protein n=1 Tax=Halobacillus mangrovi TaxID=402384 RepID=UPI003D98200A
MKRWIFYLIVFLQILFLSLMSISFYVMDAMGETIKLKTAPVDPRDPFYGDYVALSYEVEQIPEEQWAVEKELERGDRVFLLLESNNEGVYELVEASKIWKEAEENQTVLRARYLWHDEMNKTYQVDIGLNRYYVEENTGEYYEERIGESVVEIVIAPWGHKKIASLEEAAE